jgi:hypothetical protein
MTADTEQESQSNPGWRGTWRCAAPWFLGLAVLSAIVLGPYWLISWVAGFLVTVFLWLAFLWCCLIGWATLFVVACVRFSRNLGRRRKRWAALWLSMALGIVLAHSLFWIGTTPKPLAFFGRGLLARFDIRTDIDAVRAWVASLDPNDCMTTGYSSEPEPWRYLSREEQPQLLKHQGDNVSLELDAEGRPSVRLEWGRTRAGTFGLVIGHRGMKTPASEPGMYGEKRTGLRPGIYFWYEEG